MEDRARLCVGRAETLPESEADGRLLENARGDSEGSRPANKLLSNNTSDLDVRETIGPFLLINSASPDEGANGRRRATSDLLDTPTLRKTRLSSRDLHSPPPREGQRNGEGTILYVPDNHRRKRSGSVGTPWPSSNFLSVPPTHFLPVSMHRPDTPPPVWYKSRSAENLMKVPDSPPFHPAALTRPVAADSLSPVQIRSPSLARKAALHGMGINTTDVEDREGTKRFPDQEKLRRKGSDSFRRSLSASNASLSVMEALRAKRQSDQLLAMEVTNHVRQWRRQGQADS